MQKAETILIAFVFEFFLFVYFFFQHFLLSICCFFNIWKWKIHKPRISSDFDKKLKVKSTISNVFLFWAIANRRPWDVRNKDDNINDKKNGHDKSRLSETSLSRTLGADKSHNPGRTKRHSYFLWSCCVGQIVRIVVFITDGMVYINQSHCVRSF